MERDREGRNKAERGGTGWHNMVRVGTGTVLYVRDDMEWDREDRTGQSEIEWNRTDKDKTR